jgi:hypothetical protein
VEIHEALFSVPALREARVVRGAKAPLHHRGLVRRHRHRGAAAAADLANRLPHGASLLAPCLAHGLAHATTNLPANPTDLPADLAYCPANFANLTADLTGSFASDSADLATNFAARFSPSRHPSRPPFFLGAPWSQVAPVRFADPVILVDDTDSMPVTGSSVRSANSDQSQHSANCRHVNKNMRTTSFTSWSDDRDSRRAMTAVTQCSSRVALVRVAFVGARQWTRDVAKVGYIRHFGGRAASHNPLSARKLQRPRSAQ